MDGAVTGDSGGNDASSGTLDGGPDASMGAGGTNGDASSEASAGGDAGDASNAADAGDDSAVATYNDPCSDIGSGACLGHAQTRQLVCDGTQWVANGTCPAGTLCDTTPGAGAGLCLPIVALCDGATPGEVVCEGTTRITCGPDLVTTTPLDTCTNQACIDGACVGVCTPQSTQCSDNGVQTCDASGQWATAVACAGQTCSAGACVGVCEPGTRCSGNGVETCAPNGQWSSPVPCSSQACVAGACTGICEPTATQCSGNGVQSCDASGTWGTVTPCTNQACANGACTGVCTPANTQCFGNVVYTCDSTGQWGSAVACVNQACVGGACVGVCEPGDTRCVGNGVETCNASGQWGSAVACTNQACVGGECTGVCAPGATRCSGNDVQTCDATGQWGTGVPCPSTEMCSAGSCVASFASCVGLPATCGPAANENCCTSLPVTGGTFSRGYDGVSYTDATSVATVSSFRLDRFEVTVGRFRNFIAAWNSGWRPAAGDGKHMHLNGGNGLALTSGGYEAGWNPTWGFGVPVTLADWNANLACQPYSTWTPSAGARERAPVNCVTWYEHYAFCIWDGGFLPSEAEWNYAASGGSEQRVYPWSVGPTSTVVDDTYAVYCGSTCSIQDVGSRSPKGDGKYGQADLAGNLWEWTLDTHNMAYITPCVDCVYMGSPAQPPPWGCTPGCPVVRGESFQSTAVELVTSFRSSTTPGPERQWNTGIRCARAP